jgi:hypothetical protein
MKKLDKSKLVMSLSKKEKLAPYLDKAIQEFDEPFKFDYEPKKADVVPAWHPSGDCTPTVEQLYKQATKTLSDEPPRLILPQKAMMVGHYWHQFLQHIVLEKLEFCEPDAIERKGVRTWYHRKCKPYQFAIGSGDVAPIELPRGWKGIVDFKTMGSGSFKQAALPEMFAGKYEAQINIYMDFFNEERAMLLCINKDTPHDFKEIIFVRNQPLIDLIYEKWEFVSRCISEGSMPLEHVEPILPFSGPYEGT